MIQALPSQQAFIKLNTRSPKDVVFMDKSLAHTQSVLAAVQEDVGTRREGAPPLRDWEVYQAFVRACMRSSRVSDGEQVHRQKCV